jgi:hypothetical protein
MKEFEVGGTCGTHGGRGEVFTWFWLGSPNVRDHWGRSRRRWEDNIKMDLREIEIDGANWIQLAQDMV